MDIARHPLLKQCHELCLAIEACGASPELTDAVAKASELIHDINKLLDRLATAKAALEKSEAPFYEGMKALDEIGVAHDWQCVSSGEYDFTYECLRCRRRHTESVDKPGSEPPVFGCAAKER